MKPTTYLKNLTLKQANTITIVVLMFFTMFFVGLLIDEIYVEYDKNLTSETSLEFQKKEQKSILVRTILDIATLAFIIFGIFLALNTMFSKLLQNDIDRFLKFFNKASKGGARLQSSEIFFQDFKQMVEYANEMVSTIDEQKTSLKELNLSLEERVRKKTQNLIELNTSLREQKNFSDELLKAQREFLRHTIHETSTPLSVILTSLDLYTMKHPKDRHLSKIEVALKNMFSIYDDLSYLIKKDHIEYKKREINLGQYVRSRVDFFDEVAHFSHLSFELDYEDIFILFNETKLQRIVDNTLSNAIKYTLAKQIIKVVVKKDENEVLFEVSSKSKIIKDSQKIFEAYYREEFSKEGFGIGLGLVKSICDEEGVGLKLSSSDELTSFGYKFLMVEPK